MVSVSESMLYSRSLATSSPLYSGSTLDVNEYTFRMSLVFLLKMVPSVICISYKRGATSWSTIPSMDHYFVIWCCMRTCCPSLSLDDEVFAAELLKCLSCTYISLVKSRFGVTLFHGGMHRRLSLSPLPIRYWAGLYPHWRGVFWMISNPSVMSCLVSTCSLIMALVILTVASANPFDCGYRGLEVMWWIPHAVMNLRKRWDLYWVPLSCTNSSCIPCRLKMSFMTVIISADVIRWS